MSGEFLEALQQIAKEKDIPLDTLIETVESALATAYKKNNPMPGEVKVSIDQQPGLAPRLSRCTPRNSLSRKSTNDYSEIGLAEAPQARPQHPGGRNH